MTAMRTPQDELAAIQTTLAHHADDLARIKQQLPEVTGAVRAALEQQTAEFTAAHERIWQELRAIQARLDAQDAAQAHTDREITNINRHIGRIDSNIERIDGEIIDLKDTVRVLTTKTDAVIAQMDAISRTLTETSSRVGNLTGSRFERRVAKTIPRRTSRTIGLSQVRVLHTGWGETDAALLTTLNDANAVSDEEYEDLLDADIILAGQNAAGQRAYAVVEVGVTVNSTHVNRAARRALTLARAIGDECSAVVVGNEIPDAERERATRVSVDLIIVAGRDER